MATESAKSIQGNRGDGIHQRLEPKTICSIDVELNSTQTAGGSVFWYYDCTDGQIQLVLQAVPLNTAGFMEGRIIVIDLPKKCGQKLNGVRWVIPEVISFDG